MGARDVKGCAQKPNLCRCDGRQLAGLVTFYACASLLCIAVTSPKHGVPQGTEAREGTLISFAKPSVAPL
jgi:hypothetical protein